MVLGLWIEPLVRLNADHGIYLGLSLYLCPSLCFHVLEINKILKKKKEKELHKSNCWVSKKSLLWQYDIHYGRNSESRRDAVIHGKEE